MGATRSVVPCVADTAFSSSFRTAAPPARLWTALAVSAALHLCIAAALQLKAPPRPRPERAIPLISARLAVTEPAAQADFTGLRLPRDPAPQRPAQGEAVAPSRRTPELAYYAATELDVLPRLLAPLELHRLGGATGRIRAVVGIDEGGMVKDVEIDGTDSAAREALNKILAAARFAPAVKDERPVRSRIVLDFSGY